MAIAINRRNASQLNAIVAKHVDAGTVGHPAAQAAIAQLNARAWAAECTRLDTLLATGSVLVTGSQGRRMTVVAKYWPGPTVSVPCAACNSKGCSSCTNLHQPIKFEIPTKPARKSKTKVAAKP